ncbi:MAG: tetratricopeptide repeat protein [Alicyclobacillaceae bacterium]|nr:tetratricopeptide repeat protein [Alicyclobacillaceae bacterium]
MKVEITAAGKGGGAMLRPQPIGVFPGTAGFMILPPVPEAQALLPELLRGYLPERWPEAWVFFAKGVEGESEASLLPSLPEGPEGIYNRFVLQPEADVYRWARERLEGDYARLLDAVAWRFGMCAEPPDLLETDGEIRAFLLAAQAYDAIDRGAWEAGLARLQTAAEAAEGISPVFASRLYAEWAASKQMREEEGAIDGYRKALELLEGTAFREAQAELWFQLGTAYQSRADGRKGFLLEAARCYQEALKVFRRESHPDAYAMAQMNLALTYLAMPSMDRGARLRAAVAVQGLREALRIFQKDTHPDLWASATVNLANALQHVPTSHPEENLWEAVALYEEVLEFRREEEDPVGYARVLANQGNALAHLGAFSRAMPRLEKARSIFLEHGEKDAAAALDGILEEIVRLRRQQAPDSAAEASGGD